jgi:hypothetical protein
MHLPRQNRRLKIRLIASVCGCFAAIVVVGCGGSSSSNVPAQKAPTQQARPTPGQSNADVGDAKPQQTHGQSAQGGSTRNRTHSSKPPSDAAVTSPQPARPHRARPTPSTSNDGVSPTAPKRLNPCTLVSTSEAQAITGETITGRAEAPLGPTCIYKVRGAASEITLAVESGGLSQARHHMTEPSRVAVRGRQGYCGKLGTETLLVPLGSGRLLNVTAPCSVAQRFAALALGRLQA